ncbi:MAG: hypothetical protein WEA99_13830 [Brumimicrobium sp.]
MKKFTLNNILKIVSINNEFELEQATAFYNKLRLLIKEDVSLKPLRQHLADLIEAYEDEHWSDEEKISDKQITESDQTMKMIAYQNAFVQKRKKLIMSALKKNDLIQNDLAKILGHRKSYMSELMNGVRPFSQNDIVILNRILDLQFKDLIPPIIKEKDAIRIRMEIRKLNKSNLKLKRKRWLSSIENIAK